MDLIRKDLDMSVGRWKAVLVAFALLSITAMGTEFLSAVATFERGIEGPPATLEGLPGSGVGERRLIRETLDTASAFLVQLFSTGREPMICSEFVFRCYREGLPGSLDVLERSPGALAFGERAVPVGKTRGIHRGSALARLLGKSGGELPGGMVDLAGPLRAAEPLDVSAVEEGIEAYFHDLQKQAPRAARIDLMSPELQPSFERFAASLHRARRRPEKTAQSRAVLLGELFDVAADFVTPGDLQKSRSLAFCGKLKTRE